MNHLYSAGIIPYFMNNGQINYLLLHYNDGHWDFPKGKIESNETKENAAQRELQEETGLTAQLHDNFMQSFSYIFHDQEKILTQKTVYFFVGSTTDTSVKLSCEHIDFQWLTYDNAIKRLTYNNAKDVLTKSHKFLLHVSSI